MRVAETNRSRLPLYADRTLARSVAAVLATLNSEIAALEARAAEIVAADPNLKARFDTVRAEGSLFLGRDKGGSSSTAGEAHRPADPLRDEARQPSRDGLGNVNGRHAPGEAGKLHMDAITSIGTVQANDET
jgi:hypothetical protein